MSDGLEPWHMMAVATVAATAVGYALLKPKPGGDPGLSRRLSFTSQTMAAGSWPEGFAMADPIINAVLSFDVPPTRADLESLILEIMQYDRFKGVPVEVSPGQWCIKMPPDDGASRVDAAAKACAERHLTKFNVKGFKGLWEKVR